VHVKTCGIQIGSIIYYHIVPMLVSLFHSNIICYRGRIWVSKKYTTSLNNFASKTKRLLAVEQIPDLTLSLVSLSRNRPFRYLDKLWVLGNSVILFSLCTLKVLNESHMCHGWISWLSF
jgi:hypothetical protein